MVRKAHSRSWLCMRALGFYAHLNAKKICYITMVRSVLEYAATIWSPNYKYLIMWIENVQRRVTNYILNNPKRPDPGHKDYKTRLLELKLLPLTYRREIMDIQLFLKLWNSENKLGLDKILTFSQPGDGRITRAMTTGLHLKCQKTRLVTTTYFYPYRLTQILNKLPCGTRHKLRNLP